AFDGITSMPFLGDSLKNVDGLNQFIRSFDAAMVNLGNNVGAVDNAEAYLRRALFDVLGPGGAPPILGGINGNGVDPSDLVFTDGPNGSFDLEARLHDSVGETAPLPFDLGLGGLLTLDVRPTLNVQTTVDYLLHAHFDPASGQPVTFTPASGG